MNSDSKSNDSVQIDIISDKQVLYERFKSLMKDGPMFDASNNDTRYLLLKSSIHRASTKNSNNQVPLNACLKEAKPFRNQVGGHKPNNPKKTFLKAGSYVLKPLQTKDRGIRELFFYEALANASILTKVNADEKIKGVSHENIILKWLATNMKRPIQDDHLCELLNDISIFPLIQKMKREIDLLQRLASFVPPYFGFVQVCQTLNQKNLHSVKNDGSNIITSDTFLRKDPIIENIIASNSSYMVLRDVSCKYVKPFILDLKMGQQTYEPDASPIKIQEEKKKYSMQETFGFRIVGMKIPILDTSSFFNCGNIPSSQEERYHVYDKNFGYGLDSKLKMLNAFRTFFYAPMLPDMEMNNNDKALLPKMTLSTLYQRQVMLSKLLSNLNSLHAWFQENDVFSFYASSLLVSFDGSSTNIDQCLPRERDSASSSKETENGTYSIDCGLHMIDFCHVRREKFGQPGYLFGIRTLMNMWNIVESEIKTEIKARLLSMNEHS